jgi:chromosomal replication initiation ATPase DnaA
MRVTHHLPKQKKDTLKEMAVHFCQYFNISSQMLYIKSNKEEVVECKRLFIAYANPKFGPSKVGSFLGYHHSTIIHHQDRHDELMDTDPDYRHKFLKFSMEL